MDTDKNNYTTKKEFKKYWSQAHTEREVNILSSVFPAVDDNQSGVLEFDEILRNGKKIIVKSGLLGIISFTCCGVSSCGIRFFQMLKSVSNDSLIPFEIE